MGALPLVQVVGGDQFRLALRLRPSRWLVDQLETDRIIPLDAQYVVGHGVDERSLSGSRGS